MLQFESRFSSDTRVNAIGWLLVLSYGIGSPAFALAEYLVQFTSTRFGLPSGLVYLVCACQLAGAFALLVPTLRLASLTGLTIISVGAVTLHINIGSPLTAIPAAAYTLAQLWLGYRVSNVADRDRGQ